MAQQSATSPTPDERFKTDILVIVAHPDDESLIAGYLARAVLDEHKRVAVIFATRGDAGQNLVGYEQARTLAEIREMEARQALASIGISNVWFLRAPDTPTLMFPTCCARWERGTMVTFLARWYGLSG